MGGPRAMHLIVCLLVFIRPTGISVTDGRGGAFEHVETGPIRSTLIQIAPYTLPLLLTPVRDGRSNGTYSCCDGLGWRMRPR